jgi:hypothetical protein
MFNVGSFATSWNPPYQSAPVIFIRMQPNIGRDLAVLGQPNHVNRWRVTRCAARPTFDHRFQLSDRRIARAPDRIARHGTLGAEASLEKPGSRKLG